MERGTLEEMEGVPLQSGSWDGWNWDHGPLGGMEGFRGKD